MAAQHTLHIALADPPRPCVGPRVTSGQHAASEVIPAALRLLIEREAAEAGRARARPGPDRAHGRP